MRAWIILEQRILEEMFYERYPKICHGKMVRLMIKDRFKMFHKMSHCAEIYRVVL